jgi:acetyl esterase/lipase
VVNRAKMLSFVARVQGERLPISTQPASFVRPAGVPTLHPATSEPIAPVRRDQVQLRRNIEYASRANHRFRMDVHVPRAGGPHPLVVYLPGGGFVTCVRRAGGERRAYLASRGFVVASIDYGTVPQTARFVDGIADVRAAIRFLRANAEQFTIDPTRVALWGESAGGYLAAMTALTEGDARFDQGPHLDQPSSVDAVVDFFGAADLSRIADGFDARAVALHDRPANASARYVLGHDTRLRLSDRLEEAAAANPVALAAQRESIGQRFLLFHGTDDRIVSPNQSIALHAALRAGRADAELYLVEGAEHGDIAVVGATSRRWSTVEIMDRVVDFLAARAADPTEA